MAAIYNRWEYYKCAYNWIALFVKGLFVVAAVLPGDLGKLYQYSNSQMSNYHFPIYPLSYKIQHESNCNRFRNTMNAKDSLCRMELADVKETLRCWEHIARHNHPNSRDQHQFRASSWNTGEPKFSSPSPKVQWLQFKAHGNQSLSEKGLNGPHQQRSGKHNVLAWKRGLGNCSNRSDMHATDLLPLQTDRQMTGLHQPESPKSRCSLKPGSLIHVRSMPQINRSIRSLEDKLSSIFKLLSRQNQQSSYSDAHHFVGGTNRRQQQQSFGSAANKISSKLLDPHTPLLTSLQPPTFRQSYRSPSGQETQKTEQLVNAAESENLSFHAHNFSFMSHNQQNTSFIEAGKGPLPYTDIENSNQLGKTLSRNSDASIFLRNIKFGDRHGSQPVQIRQFEHREGQHIERVTNKLTAFKMTESHISESMVSCLKEDDSESAQSQGQPCLAEMRQCNHPSDVYNSDNSSTMASTHIFMNRLCQPVRMQSKLSDFEIRAESIGKGKLGQVHLARHKASGFIVALKAVSKSKIQEFNMLQRVINEVKIHSIISHPNIIKFYGHFIGKPIKSAINSREEDTLYLILEYAEGCTLFEYLNMRRRLPVREVIPILRDIIASIIYLHEKSIAHRDIKPENILITNPTLASVRQRVVKLCDFGWAAFMHKPRKTYCGTFDYIPPEVLQKKEYGLSFDIWGIGTLAYQLLTGRMPFEGSCQKIIHDKCNQIKINFPSISTHFPLQAKQFIKALLQAEPSMRPKCQDLLKMPLFTDPQLLQIGI